MFVPRVTSTVCVCVCVEHCYQPVAAGPCLNSMSRYHYNSVSGECEEFQYGGCGGNRNRFLNKQQCEDECRNSTTPAPTALPTTPGKIWIALFMAPGFGYFCKKFTLMHSIWNVRFDPSAIGEISTNSNQLLIVTICQICQNLSKVMLWNMWISYKNNNTWLIVTVCMLLTHVCDEACFDDCTKMLWSSIIELV